MFVSCIHCCFLLILLSQLVASSTELTSDIGSSNDTVVICPNELVTLTCQTSSGALVWFYLDDSVTFDSQSNINEQFVKSSGGNILEFELIEKTDDNFTSTAIVNTTNGLAVACSPDGLSNDIAITLSITDTPLPPAVNVIDVKADLISLKWAAVSSADSYQITVSPNPSGGVCESGTCSFNGTIAVIDHLPLNTFEIDIASVNCAGKSTGVMIIQDTFPKAIVEIATDADVDNDRTNLTVCPNDSVNITCETKGALLWLLYDMIAKTYEDSSEVGVEEVIDGFVYTLLERDGIDFTSLVETKMNTSFRISCSPTGVAMDLLNNADITVSIIGVLAQPQNLITKTICLNYVELEWDLDMSADEYYITVSPPPIVGTCADGICDSDNSSVICNESKCAIIVDGLEPIQYSYSVRSVNCAGMSQSATVTAAVNPKIPSQPTITLLTAIDGSDDHHASVFIEWMPPIVTCQTSSIDNFTVTITSYGSPEFHTRNCCSDTFQLERCGVYSFTVQANSRIGSGPKSLASPISLGELSQSVSTSKLTDDSVLLLVTVVKCLVPAIVNISVEVSRLTIDIIQRQNFQYPSNSRTANIMIKDLEADTNYNVTITVYYEQLGEIMSLAPQMLQFQTSENIFLSFQTIVIGSLTGFTFLGIIIIILIIVIGILCLRQALIKKKVKGIRRQHTQIEAKQVEVEKNIEDVQTNMMGISQLQRNYPQHHRADQVISPKPQLYPSLIEEATNL